MIAAKASANQPDCTPIEIFSECHGGILAALDAFAELPALVTAADRARNLARAMVKLFDGDVAEHHADEEKELFPAVLRSARPGEEKVRVQGMVSRLTAEHRAIEVLWRQLRPAVKRIAAGSASPPGLGEIAQLAGLYGRHAAYEELEFLPLAREVLGRNGNHMAALALSLHLRHAPQPMPGYI